MPPCRPWVPDLGKHRHRHYRRWQYYDPLPPLSDSTGWVSTSAEKLPKNLQPKPTWSILIMYDGNIARHIASRSEAVIDRRDRAFSLYDDRAIADIAGMESLGVARGLQQFG